MMVLVLFGMLIAATGSFLSLQARADDKPDDGLDCKNGACSYVLLEPLPNVPGNTVFGNDSGKTFYAYINGIIMLLVIVGSMLAVVRFSIGGIMYMTSDIANTRTRAKSQMWACVCGLLILVCSVLILNTINPKLAKLNLLDDLQALKCVGNYYDTLCANGGTGGG